MLEPPGYAFYPSEPHHPQTDATFEVGKQHFDLSPLGERGHAGTGSADIVRDLSCGFACGFEPLIPAAGPGGIAPLTDRYRNHVFTPDIA